jgi:hypothetical protein
MSASTYNKSVNLLSYVAGPHGEKNCTFIGFMCELLMIGISVVAKPFYNGSFISRVFSSAFKVPLLLRSAVEVPKLLLSSVAR